MSILRRAAPGALAALLLTATTTHAAAVVPASAVGGLKPEGVVRTTFERIYTLGTDPAPCEDIGGAAVLLGPDASCTVRRGQPVAVLVLGAACSDKEPDPFFGATPADRASCALGHVRTLTSATVTVDGGKPQDVTGRRFFARMPDTTVVTKAEVFGIPAGTRVALSGAGQFAVVRGLSPGTHTITLKAEDSIGPFEATYVVTVPRR